MASRVVSWIATTAAVAGLLTASVRPALAQARDQRPVLDKQLKRIDVLPGAPASAPPPSVESPDAERTRNALMQLLEHYPPSVGRVVKLDPSLLANADYLATYPALKSFAAQHPEVERNPGYYFDQIHIPTEFRDTRGDSARVLEDLFGWIGGLSVGTLIAVTFGWLVRLLVDYRRWSRLAKVQAEAHGKLLDRLTANEEVLAYVQSPAGSRFLESAPIALDPGSRRIGAPFNRILWSLQAGVVLLALGLGLRYLSGHITTEAAEPLFALGVVAMALGIGFVVSSGISYAMSKHLGLFDPARGTESRTV